LKKALHRLQDGFPALPPLTFSDPNGPDLERVLLETADRLRDNYPYFHPLYAGQMLKPPHRVARLAYALAQWINPNNHALDGGRASSAMEKEAVAELARMFGWQTHLGHLCSGGTMANLEALWIAGQLAPGKKIVASQQAHYTHRRLSEVLKLDGEGATVDRFEISKSQSTVDVVETLNDSAGQILKWILCLRKSSVAVSSSRWVHALNLNAHLRGSSSDSSTHLLAWLCGSTAWLGESPVVDPGRSHINRRLHLRLCIPH